MPPQTTDAQLALTLSLPAKAELKNYIVGENAIALEQTRLIAKGMGEFCVYLWGASGVGKSHLLQGACEQATMGGLSSFYLSCATDSPITINDLKGLERLDLVCIDDIHLIAGLYAWEEALFHLYNKMRDRGKHLLVTADMAPMTLPVNLPDLRTRLGWGVTYHLHALSDDEKLKALIARARQKGLDLSEEVGKFIIDRTSRSMGELLLGLDKLDEASLLLQHKLTIPFVKKILNI